MRPAAEQLPQRARAHLLERNHPRHGHHLWSSSSHTGACTGVSSPTTAATVSYLCMQIIYDDACNVELRVPDHDGDVTHDVNAVGP